MEDSVKITWRGDQARRVVLKHANNRISAAGVHLRNAIRQNISTPSKSAKGSKLGKAITEAKKG
jgi:hypothetical protein